MGIIAIFAMILRFFHIPGGSFLGIISMALLSMFYMGAAFLLFNAKGTYQILGSVFIGLTFSILVIGILFMLMYWPGAQVMLTVGLLSLVPIGIVSAVKYNLTKQAFYKPILIRCAIIGVIGVLLFALY